MPSPLNIAVVGAGFAGLAAAALLARQGHRVTVLERFDEPRSVGAGVLIQPSGIAAAKAMGIHSALAKDGAPITHLWGVNHRSQPVVDLRYDQWQPASHGLGLHRGVIFQALWNAATQAGVTVQTGQQVDDLPALAARHDLVVIANGAASTLRAQTGIRSRDRLYPWGAVWALLDDPGSTHGQTLWQWYRGASQMLGVMPTGRAPGHDTPVVSMFWSLHADRFDAWRAQGLNAWKESLLALHPACGPLLQQVTHIDQLTWARYRDVVMPRYNAGNCVVIGDAAHATSPQLGQGTNLALLDALELSRCVHPSTSAVGVPEALAEYTRRRAPHSHFYSQASRLLTPIFQSDQTVLPWLRDVFMARSVKWPLVGPLMGAVHRETLVGVRRNWLGVGSLDVDHIEHGN